MQSVDGMSIITNLTLLEDTAEAIVARLPLQQWDRLSHGMLSLRCQWSTCACAALPSARLFTEKAKVGAASEQLLISYRDANISKPTVFWLW